MMISAKVCFLGQKICQRIAGKSNNCRYIVKDTDVETDKEIVHRYQTQEDAWNAAMLCANRQTFDLSVKMPGLVHMSVNYKEQTISVIGSDNQVKRLYKVTTASNQS